MAFASNDHSLLYPTNADSDFSHTKLQRKYFSIKMPYFLLLRLIPFSLFSLHFPVILLMQMSSETLVCRNSSVGRFCHHSFLVILDNAKKRRRPRKKEIFICSDCWLLVFDFLAPSQLGLEIALINRRFDRIVDKHFKTRKWKLEKQFIIQWDIEENGTKKMQIVKSDGNPLPIPQNPLPNKVIGFNGVQIIYIDQNVVAFLRRFHRHIFAVCSIYLDIITENVRILDFVMLNIWPMFRHSMHVLYLSSIAFRRLRKLAPSLLSDCPSLRFVCFKAAIFPEFPHDESANASDGQAMTKWLFTPRPNSVPKLFQCSVNSTEEQWSSMMEQLKAAFFNASSPVLFAFTFGPLLRFTLLCHLI